MNEVKLKGTLRNIEYSHSIQDTNYYKAQLVIPNENNVDNEDIINIKFKQFSNKYNENDEVNLIGNLRTFSQKLQNKNKVNIYVFTYFDSQPEDNIITNEVLIDGRICKKNPLHKTHAGKDVIDFTLANNLKSSDDKFLNCYIPICAWGKLAKQVDLMPIGKYIQIKGKIHSRVYRKYTSETDYDLMIAYEVVAEEIIINKE